MKWADPVWLNLCWIAILTVIIFFLSRKKNDFAQKHLLMRLTDSFSKYKYYFSLTFVLLGIFLLIFALARPQYGVRSEMVKQKGLEIVLAVDVSRSMLAEDIKPNRLKRAQYELSQIIKRLPGHRVGLVAFKGGALALCPLTLDHSALELYLDILSVDLLSSEGTSIHSALKTVNEMFSSTVAVNKVLILITDGGEENNEALSLARSLGKKGVKIYCIGIGSEEGEPIPIYDDKDKLIGHQKDKEGNVILTKINISLLKQIANYGYGKFFLASPGVRELSYILQGIEELELSEFEETLVTQYEERYQWPLSIGFVFILLGWLLGSKRNLWKQRWGLLLDRIKFSKKVSIFIHLLFFGSIFFQVAWISTANKENKRGMEKYEKEDYQEAKEHFVTAEEKSKQNIIPIYNQGLTSYKLKDWDKAKEKFEEVSMIREKDLQAKSLFSLGNIAFQEQKLDEAIELYKKVLDINPNYFDAKYNLELANHLKNMSQADQQKEQDQDKKDDKQDQQDKEEKNKDQDKSNEQDKEKEQADQQKEQDQDKKDEQQDQQNKDDSEKGKQEDKKEEESSSKKDVEQKENNVPQNQNSTQSQKNEGKSSGEQNLEEIANVLDAIENDEKELKMQLYKMRTENINTTVNQDW